jgi:hypothetical protein
VEETEEDSKGAWRRARVAPWERRREAVAVPMPPMERERED